VKDERVERFESHGWLEWWANSSTVLGNVEIGVVVAVDSSGWVARGQLISADDDDREGFMFLCELDPVFTLRFDGDGTLPVTVHDVEEGGRRFWLSEYLGPEDRRGNYQIDL
jgi:hypothetical protein